jgi:hypothetical protein
MIQEDYPARIAKNRRYSFERHEVAKCQLSKDFKTSID